MVPQSDVPNYDTCNLMWYCDLISFRFLGDVLRSYYSDNHDYEWSGTTYVSNMGTLVSL